MMESGDSPGTEQDESALDLSSLLNNDALGPDWTSGKQPKTSKTHYREDSGDRGRRDRRSGGGRAPDRRQEGRRRDNRPPRPYQPDYNVQVQPNNQAFSALIKAMRDSCRTFELFEIANLFLSKPDRFVAKLLPQEGAPPELASFHISVPDGIGFETEEEAVAHVLANHMAKFFEVEETEVEPPKGTFNVVNRCSVTGTLLAPPNYHRYQHILQEHYASRINGMTFERFASRVETVSEQEVIDEWVESMKKGYTYKNKDGSGEFSHLEEARRHLLMNHKDKVVKTSDMCRVDGRDLEKLPHSRIRRSIEAVLEGQRKFPLEFSNHLRGRLRRANFTIYKRGGRGGVTFVCAVRRQYRTAESSFSDSIQALLKFIEDNQNVTVHQLLSSDNSPGPSDEAEPTGEGTGGDPADDTAAPTELVGERPDFPTLGQDLRWLVQYGFVTEYSDGRLFAPPIREKKGVSPKATKGPRSNEAAETASESTEAAEQEPVAEPDPTEEPAQSEVPVAAAEEEASPQEPEAVEEPRAAEPGLEPEPGEDASEPEPVEAAGQEAPSTEESKVDDADTDSAEQAVAEVQEAPGPAGADGSESTGPAES